MTQALIFILKTLTHLYLLLLLLRFWLPVLRADFRNPVAQGVLRLTSPLVVPLRRFVPAIGRVDTATVLIAFTIEYLLILLLLTLSRVTPQFVPIAVTATTGPGRFEPQHVLLRHSDQNHHELGCAAQLQSRDGHADDAVGAVLRPFRQLIPPIGGLDISPILAIVLIQAGIIVLQTYKPLPI